jgi:hypothetical protein
MQVAALIAIIAVPVIIVIIFVCVVICLMQSDTVRKEVARAAYDDAVMREDEIEDVVKLKGVEGLDAGQLRRWNEHQAYLAANARAEQERLRAAAARGPADPNAADAWRYTGR